MEIKKLLSVGDDWFLRNHKDKQSSGLRFYEVLLNFFVVSGNMDSSLSLGDFVTSIEKIVDISDGLMDGWTLQEKEV